MNNKLKMITISALSMIIGFGAANYALSDIPSNYKVAVVDIQKIVNESKQFTALKEEQKKKVAELTSFVKVAKENISKEKDATKKKALEDKYSKELTAKKNAIEKNYSDKLIALDKNISTTIKTKAKEGNYNLVLAKGVVLSGGDDITAAVSAALK